jgi:hypothetical protein
MADHAGFGDEGREMMKGKDALGQWTYVDAKGRQFTSAKQLGCPTFFLDEMGGIRENREMVREVDDRVDYTDDRVDDVEDRVGSQEHRVDSFEDRLIDLERENVVLREKLAQPIDVTAMVEWLSDMAVEAARQKMETVEVQVEGRQVAALPPPLVDLIIDVGSVQKERALVPRAQKAKSVRSIEREEPE